jgi:hypothetical protein
MALDHCDLRNDFEEAGADSEGSSMRSLIASQKRQP